MQTLSEVLTIDEDKAVFVCPICGEEQQFKTQDVLTQLTAGGVDIECAHRQLAERGEGRKKSYLLLWLSYTETFTT